LKFLTKINRNYLFLFVLMLFTISIGGYFILKWIILEDTKESLLEKEIHIVGQIKETGELPNIYPIVEVKIINHQTNQQPLFREVYIEDELEHELEPFLEYSNELKIGESWYSIQIRQATFESEDLVVILSLLLFILLLSAFGISYFITKKMNNTVWADFEQNLSEIESFSFNENITLNLKKSGIDEFGRLNKVIENLTRKQHGHPYRRACRSQDQRCRFQTKSDQSTWQTFQNEDHSNGKLCSYCPAIFFGLYDF